MENRKLRWWSIHISQTIELPRNGEYKTQSDNWKKINNCHPRKNEVSEVFMIAKNQLKHNSIHFDILVRMVRAQYSTMLNLE